MMVTARHLNIARRSIRQSYPSFTLVEKRLLPGM
jgi:hypothetical protein